MKDERNRLGKGFAVAIVAHVIFALLLGVFGLTFNSNRPPEILEVSLVAGGGAPEEPQEEIVEEAEPVVEEEDQIVESKEKPKEEPKKPVAEKKEQKPKANPKKGDNKPVGKGDGIGDGQGVPVTPPRPIRTIEPKYPASARNAAIEGLVKIKTRGSAPCPAERPLRPERRPSRSPGPRSLRPAETRSQRPQRP